MRLSGRTPNQRGDTIVEVLISLLVISVILAGAFVLSHTSSRNVRDSQEHAEALGFLQAQVELLRTAATGADAPTTFNSSIPNPFCMTESATVINTSGNNCLKGDQNRYKISIKVAPDSSLTDPTTTFNLNVTWDAIGGGTASEDIIYRVGVAN